MKKLIILLSVVCAAPAINAQSVFEKEPYLTKSLSNESIKNVQVETSGGAIVVSGVSSDAKIEVYVSPNNNITGISKDEIRQRLEENYDLKVAVENNKLVAIAKQKHDNMNWKKSLNISFKIYVPSTVSTNLSTSGGSIRLTNLKGEQQFRTSGGSLHVDNVSGKINGRTSGGSIHVSNASDDIDLSTSGGSIEASSCNGKLNLQTSGGSLHLNDLNGTIDASTSGGRIDGGNIKGELTASTSGGSIHLNSLYCSLETSTSGGSIDVSISTLGKFVKISNSGGNINLQLPSNKGLDLQLRGNKVKAGTLSNFSGSVEEDDVNGKMNGGGTPVNVSAGSGTVYLSFK